MWHPFQVSKTGQIQTAKEYRPMCAIFAVIQPRSEDLIGFHIGKRNENKAGKTTVSQNKGMKMRIADKKG